MTGIWNRACAASGSLTDGRVWFDGDGRPFRWLHARDGTAFSLWHLSGGKSALLSGLASNSIEAIAAQWRCCEWHMGVRDKARVCREIAGRHGIPFEEMAFLGDDIIDVSAMRAVGLGVAVADAVQEAKNAASVVLQTRGGAGALRELVERILRAQGRLDEVVAKYCSRNDDEP
jgi:3-deoxy-D-manno-octulosonate 8-phosphate phosphatase (KDO 8-P phosphatase)